MSAPERALFEKLRRLRREGGSPASAAQPTDGPPRARGGLPPWLQSRLKRGARARAAEEAADPALAARSLQPPAELVARANDRGAFAERVLRFAREHRHGAWALSEVETRAPGTLGLVARDPALEELDLRRAVYLDIETTGLSGGSGTVAFLVALGTFTPADTPAGFELWQGFLRGPEEEPALLSEVARRIRAAEGVVSFFGKSFDRHRLEDKMRQHGVDPPFEGRAHFDLYHPLQRLYRAELADGRLATMESALCGVERRDDLAGRYAPEAWFDFLAGRPHRLEAVFRHNADDVLSLVVLAAHAGRSVAEERADGLPLSGPPAARALGLARLLADAKELRPALAWARRALERETASERECRRLVADLHRRLGDKDRALTGYASLAADRADRHALHAAIALAKLCEHHARDARRALAAVERARELLRRLPRQPSDLRLARELARRAERLGARLPPDPPHPVPSRDHA